MKILPQIIYLILLLTSLLVSANFHGKLRVRKHNFWVDLIGYSIMFLILYWGGFFNVFFK